jgi:hypothetical protein
MNWGIRAVTASIQVWLMVSWRGYGGCLGRPAAVPGREPVYGAVAKPEASFAAADGTLKSMMGPVERIALLFGWPAPGLGEEAGATIDYVNSELKRLRP